MDPGHHEYILEVFADQTFVKDIVKGKETHSTKTKKYSAPLSLASPPLR